MKGMTNIFGWLAVQEEHNILADGKKHIAEAQFAVEGFAEAVRAFLANDIPSKTAAIQKVKASEHRADILKATIIDHLTTGIIHPADREELFAFVRAVDSIANRAKSAAQLLSFIEKQPPQPVLKNIAVGTDHVVNAVNVLAQAIEAATRNDLNAACRHCNEIRLIEQLADERKIVLLDAIFHVDLSPKDLLLCYHLADQLEDITDKIRDTASFIKVIVIRSA